MFSYPFIRPLWFPTFLSPIPEEEEPVSSIHYPASVHDEEMESFHEETTCSVYGPELEVSDQNQSAPRMINTERKSIESNSGRRTESVEVLKQKYLNDDIQDIPRLVQGPVRYGRLHRSRSHLNLGSQDIRTQLNKIRLRMGSSLSGDEERKLDFRCSRLKEDTTVPFKFESIGELLYGTPNLDDYDPELAALFEDYVEECDKPTRATPDTERTIRDQYLLGRLLMERVLSSETRYAFLSGYLEGVFGNDGNESTETLDDAIENKHLMHECTRDPCIDQSSHVDMIKSNQDITHKSLKEWEEQNRYTDSINSHISPEDTNDACVQENNAESETVTRAVYEDLTKCDSADSVVDNKATRKRNVLPMGKTELDLAVPEQINSPCRNNEQVSSGGAKKLFHKKLSKPGNPSNILTPNVPTLKGKSLRANSQYDLHGTESPALPNPAGDATRKEDQDECLHSQDGAKIGNRTEKGSSHSDNELSYSPFRLGRLRDLSGNINSFFAMDDDLSRSKYELYHPDMSKDVTGRDVEDDMGIIALARKKLENRFMSTAIFDEFCKRKQQEKSDVSRIKKEAREDGKSPAKVKVKIPRADSTDLGDLDGWTTSTKHLMESDNLHMSSSELLHPFDSKEASIPTITAAANTPVENQDVKKIREDSCESRTSRQATPDRATPTSAKLSDLEDKKGPKLKFETNAFKHRSPLTGDFKKAAKQVKLRLTKSCANMPKVGSHVDKAFVNVPLSKCSGYYVENKTKTTPSVAPIITLSDRLANQLRNIGSNNENTPNNITHQKGSKLTKTEANNTKAISVSLPSIEKESAVDPGISVGPSDDKITLPDINKSPTLCDVIEKDPHPNKKQDRKNANDVHGNDDGVQDMPKRSISVELPPISVKSYQKQNVTPLKNSNLDVRQQPKIDYYQDFPESFATGSLAVRAEVCTSPYQFDKCDPNKLVVKARSVSNSHEVCIACGSLNEKDVLPSSKRKDKPKRAHKSTENTSRPHCHTKTDDYKWKLDKTTRNDFMEFPKLDVAKLIDKHHSNHEINNTKECVSTKKEQHRHKTKTNNDELTFKFMGQNIKLRFECELSLADDKETKPSGNISNEKCKRLREMAKPKCRDSMKNPVSRETGIYYNAKSSINDFTSFHDNAPSPARDSPYVEYCKRKARMRCKRQQQMDNELAKLTEVVDQDMDIYEQVESKRFPTLPIKKNKLKNKGGSKKAKSKTSTIDLSPEDKNKESLIVKSGHLPLLEPEGKTKTATKAIKDSIVRPSGKTCPPPALDKINENNLPCEIRSQ